MTGGKTTKWSVIKAKKGRPTYTVLAERDGRFWFLRVMGREEMFTQSVRLDQAEAMVRDLIATWDQVPDDSFDVRLVPRLGEQVDEATEALWHVRLIEALGTALARSLAVTLVRDQHLSMRDAGKIIGLSHQRVAQLLEEHDALGGDKRPDLAYYIELVDQWAARKGAVTIRPGDDPAKLDPIRKAIDSRAASSASD